MDPMVFMNMQNQRMLENTQRSSDGLRTNMMREKKEKSNVRKNHYVSDSAELTSDLDMGGDDMMDGDFGELLGGGGGAAMFRRMWEDDIEAEEAKAKAKAKEMAADTLFDDGQGSRLITSDEHVTKEPDFTAALKAEESIENEPEPEEEKAAETSEAESEAAVSQDIIDRSGEINPFVSEGAPEEEQEEEALPPEQYAVPEDSSAAAAESVQAAETAVRSSDKSESAEYSEYPEEIDTEEPDGTRTSSLVNSLLDNSEGFILHESVQEVIEVSESRKHDLSEIKVPKELEGVLDVLVEDGGFEQASAELRFMLSRFGKGILDSCASCGIKVRIASEKQIQQEVSVIEPELKGRSIGSGAFIPQKRVCYIARECLDSSAPGYKVPRGFHPALYFFAMAWDYSMGEDGFSSLKSMVIKANAEACRTNLKDHKAPDAMACSSPVHYFAQSAEAYLSANDCTEQMWSREDLCDFDRLMYDYIEYLYNKSNA